MPGSASDGRVGIGVVGDPRVVVPGERGGRGRCASCRSVGSTAKRAFQNGTQCASR